MARYISCADTAKLVRAAIKEAFAADFPTVKFSVRSHVYSGGASINVRWTDGPTTKMVDAVVKQFSGSTFDGMIDLRSYHDSDLNGELVSYAADHVFTSRDYTRQFTATVMSMVAAFWNTEAPAMNDDGWYDWYADLKPWSHNARSTIVDMLRQAQQHLYQNLDGFWAYDHKDYGSWVEDMAARLTNPTHPLPSDTITTVVTEPMPAKQFEVVVATENLVLVEESDITPADVAAAEAMGENFGAKSLVDFNEAPAPKIRTRFGSEVEIVAYIGQDTGRSAFDTEVTGEWVTVRYVKDGHERDVLVTNLRAEGGIATITAAIENFLHEQQIPNGAAVSPIDNHTGTLYYIHRAHLLDSGYYYDLIDRQGAFVAGRMRQGIHFTVAVGAKTFKEVNTPAIIHIEQQAHGVIVVNAEINPKDLDALIARLQALKG